MALIVVRTADATSRPDGLALFGAIAWRDVFYGAIDGLLLSAFPILAVFAAFAGTDLRSRRVGKLAIGALALVASLMMTGTYHLGYEQFRSSDIRSPLTGDVVWSIPTLITLNPIAAPIAHAGLHVTAVLHSYDTDLFLPPHRETDRAPALRGTQHLSATYRRTISGRVIGLCRFPSDAFMLQIMNQTHVTRPSRSDETPSCRKTSACRSR